MDDGVRDAVRDWEWAGRYAAALTAELGSWREQRWPMPFTVERVSVSGDHRPRIVLIEYFNESGPQGFMESLLDTDLASPEADADIRLINLGEGPALDDRTWISDGRAWWSYDEVPSA